jgi:mRNA interferase RelE/StbE
MIVYLKEAVKTISAYDIPTRRRIIEAINKLPLGNVKPLKGKLINFHRLRIGKYRVIFSADNNEYTIIDVDTRGDAYK